MELQKLFKNYEVDPYFVAFHEIYHDSTWRRGERRTPNRDPTKTKTLEPPQTLGKMAKLPPTKFISVLIPRRQKKVQYLGLWASNVLSKVTAAPVLQEDKFHDPYTWRTWQAKRQLHYT